MEKRLRLLSGDTVPWTSSSSFLNEYACFAEYSLLGPAVREEMLIGAVEI
jgi:hypothetical protein